MLVEIRFVNASKKLVFDRAINTYQKGDLFCVYLEGGIVKKFPLLSIFDITETY